MTTFDSERLQQFFDNSVNGKGFPSTRKPREWIRSAGITNEDLTDIGIELAAIPDEKVSRYDVWRICRDPAQHALLGYILAMAWGGQGAKNARLAWQKRDDISPVLKQIRDGSFSRAEAYELFCKADISGLGPSFFTKLLFFFSPQPNAYIMDQWTAKSINYLTGREIVILGPHTPTRKNTGANFEEFCILVEMLQTALAERGKILSGEEVEQRIFCTGGRAAVAGKWRLIVRGHYAKKSPASSHSILDA